MAKIRISVPGYRCNQCGHPWIPRVKAQRPLICPKCKSAAWDRPKRKP